MATCRTQLLSAGLRNELKCADCRNSIGNRRCLSDQCVPVYSTIYLSFSLQMSLSPLDLSIHHEKPVIKIKRFVHYRCNITVLNLTVLYYFCVTTCSPKLSQLYKRDVTMFFSSVGY